MFNYDGFRHKVQRNSEEKVREVVYAVWYGNTLLTILFVIVMGYIFSLLMIIYKNKILGILYLIFIFMVGIYLGTRKAGVALCNSKFVYVKFRHLGYKEKEVFEVDLEKIKAISVIKLLNMRIVKMSFISNGKLQRIKFLFSSFMFGSDSMEYKKNSGELYKRLKEMQKVIDKGDF